MSKMDPYVKMSEMDVKCQKIPRMSVYQNVWEKYEILEFWKTYWNQRAQIQFQEIFWHFNTFLVHFLTFLSIYKILKWFSDIFLTFSDIFKWIGFPKLVWIISGTFNKNWMSFPEIGLIHNFGNRIFEKFMGDVDSS